jgi:hypothetical protein
VVWRGNCLIPGQRRQRLHLLCFVIGHQCLRLSLPGHLDEFLLWTITVLLVVWSYYLRLIGLLRAGYPWCPIRRDDTAGIALGAKRALYVHVVRLVLDLV